MDSLPTSPKKQIINTRGSVDQIIYQDKKSNRNIIIVETSGIGNNTVETTKFKFKLTYKKTKLSDIIKQSNSIKSSIRLNIRKE